VIPASNPDPLTTWLDELHAALKSGQQFTAGMHGLTRLLARAGATDDLEPQIEFLAEVLDFAAPAWR
jgi:hypothetical protein